MDKLKFTDIQETTKLYKYLNSLPITHVMLVCGHSFYMIFITWLLYDPFLALIIYVTPLPFKRLFRRDRPVYPGTLSRKRFGWDKWGMPSGHALMFAGATMQLYTTIGIYSAVFIPVALTGSFERVRKGAHFISDVLVGWIIGIVIVLLYDYVFIS